MSSKFIARSSVSLAAIASVLAFAQSAQAQATAQAAPQDQVQNVEEIVVKAQQAQKQVVSNGELGVLGNLDALSTPFNVSAFTAQLILDQQSETIGKVLDNDPSVRTTYGSGNQSELFVIRGFALNGDDVSISGLYGVTPRQLISPELYESVQVLNGASAFLYGAAPGGSGIGGGVNLTPKQAQRPLFRATASYSADSTYGGNVDLGTRFGPDDAFGLRVVGVYRDGDTAVDHENRHVAVLGGTFDVRKGPARAFLHVGYEDQRAEWSRPTVRLNAGIPVPRAPGASDNYGQPWTYTTLKDLYAVFRSEVDLSENVMAYFTAGARDGKEDGDYSTLTITNGVTGAATASRLYVPRKDNNQSAQLGLRAKFATGAFSHQVNLGVSATATENRNSFSFGAFPTAVRSACGAAATSFCTNLYSPVIVDKPTNSTLPASGGSLTDLPKVSTSKLKSAFFSDTISILDERVMLTVGARQQNIIVNGYNRGTLARTSHYDKSALTPVVGLVFKPTSTLSLYANRIEGLAQGPTAPVNATTVNPGEIFAPYTSVQYEAGAKLAVEGLTATAAIFQTSQPNAYNQPVTGSTTLTRYVVDGEQRNRGLEISFNGEPSKNLRFIGGVTINDATITKGLAANIGKDAIGVPKYQMNFGVEVVPPVFTALTLTGRIVRTGQQQIDTANFQALPTWNRFDLGARYVFVADGRPITLRLSAENIENKRYWYSAFGGYLLQGTPRTVKASVTFEY